MSSSRRSPHRRECDRCLLGSRDRRCERSAVPPAAHLRRQRGNDGFVSIEVAPGIGSRHRWHHCHSRRLHTRIDQPNLFVKIPATAEGVPAIQAMTAEGCSINITLIFSLPRYSQVIEAYLSGLEEHARASGDVGAVHSVASFFVSRVDSEVDRRLETIGSPEALALRGRAAVAQAKRAYQMFREKFTGMRWTELEKLGAQSAATSVGVDLDKERRILRHAVRRQSHRPRHGQHPSRNHHRRLRGPRHCRPDHRAESPSANRALLDSPRSSAWIWTP